MITVYDWWKKVESEYNSLYGSGKCHFYYDNIVNIGLQLNAKDRDAVKRQQKYPAVFLLSSVREEVRVDGSVKIRPKILIVSNSNRDYLLEERQSNVYKPILYPILDNLLALLRKYGLQNYTKYDRDYVSGALREASTVAGVSSLYNDSLDAIEVSTELIIRERC